MRRGRVLAVESTPGTGDDPSAPEALDREPDLVVDLAIDSGLEVEALELIAPFGFDSERAVAATLRLGGRRLAAWVAEGEVLRGTYELRTVPPGGSTGDFPLAGSSPVPITLRLRAVMHFELELDSGEGETLAVWDSPDTFRLTPSGAAAPFTTARGKRRQQKWSASLKLSEASRSASVTQVLEPIEIAVDLEGFEKRSYPLLGHDGEPTAKRLVLTPLALAGRLPEQVHHLRHGPGVARTDDGRLRPPRLPRREGRRGTDRRRARVVLRGSVGARVSDGNEGGAGQKALPARWDEIS